ncbi:MAG TPA: AsmA family protein [bacterium]|nr:AsmA family protein [bacterium]
MTRFRWGLIGGAILLVGVLAVAAVPFLIPVDRYRTLLEGYIRSATGRDVQIAALRLEIWPRPHVRARDVRLMNPAGFPAGPSVEAQTVNLGVNLRALLGRRLEINWVALNGVHVNFLTNTAGRSNFDLSARSGRRPAIGGGVLALTPIGAVAIKNVDLSVGSYDPGRRRTTASFVIAGLNARSRSVQATAPDLLQQIAATLDLKGARLTIPSLRVPVQVSSGTLVLAKGAVKATFAAALDRTSVTGTAQVPRIYTPVISFALAGTELDVNRLQRLFGAQTASATPVASGPKGPHRLVAAGTISLGKFAFAPLAASEVRAHLNVYTDTVHIDAYSLTAYGGRITGAAALETAQSGAPASITVHARGVDVAALLHGVGATGQVSGSLDTDGTLQTRLAGEPLAALTGAGTFAILHGSFPGLDLKNGIVRLAKVLQSNVPAGPTRFSYFGGDARIARQRISSSALRLDGDNLQATGSGSVGFDGSLNYRGTGVTALSGQTTLPDAGTVPSAAGVLGNYLPGGAGARGARIPFTLTGTLGKPHFALAGVPQFLGGTVAPTMPQAPASPQVPGLPSFLQNLPKIP